MSEVEKAEIAAAEEEKRPKLNLRMLFQNTRPRGLSGRVYDVPTANEVAVIYVGEEGVVPAESALAVHERGVKLTTISHLDSRGDPLTYPLLFPTGEDGWHPDLLDSQGHRSHRSNTIRICYLCKILSIRYFMLASFSSNLLFILLSKSNRTD